MTTLTVSIGRNVPGYPPEADARLDVEAWGAFKRHTLNAVSSAAEVLFDGEGTGHWEGQTEESYTVIAQFHYGLASKTFQALQARLKVLAIAYQQTAIALTVGETELIFADESEPF